MLIKTTLLFILLSVATTLSFGQTETPAKSGHFGVALNSSFNFNPGGIRLTPSATFFNNNHQVELGVAFYPSMRKPLPRHIGADFNYKYYPNGIEKRFSLYMIINVHYTNITERNVQSSSNTYDYIGASGGYGFQVKFLKNAYIGTNTNLGVIWRGDNGEDLFKDLNLGVSTQLNVGYRF